RAAGSQRPSQVVDPAVHRNAPLPTTDRPSKAPAGRGYLTRTKASGGRSFLGALTCPTLNCNVAPSYALHRPLVKAVSREGRPSGICAGAGAEGDPCGRAGA